MVITLIIGKEEVVSSSLINSSTKKQRPPKRWLLSYRGTSHARMRLSPYTTKVAP